MINSIILRLKKCALAYLGILIVLTIIGCSVISESPSEKYAILTMKYKVDFGMDADLLVDELTDNMITYRYFDYQHTDSPDEAITVSFEEILKMEEGIRVYKVYMYLNNEHSEEVELILSDDFIEQLENNPEFRKKLGTLLNKEFRKELKDFALTSKDIL